MVIGTASPPSGGWPETWSSPRTWRTSEPYTSWKNWVRPHLDSVYYALADSFDLAGEAVLWQRRRGYTYEEARTLGQVHTSLTDLKDTNTLCPCARWERASNLLEQADAVDRCSEVTRDLILEMAQARDQAGDTMGELEVYRNGLERFRGPGAKPLHPQFLQ